MLRKGRSFELAYADMYNLDSDKYIVESPGYIVDKDTGDNREVDVLIKYKDDLGNERSIVVECRDRKNGEDVKSIEQLIQKKEDMEVDIYVISTLYRFTKNAIIKARHYGVIIETAEMITKDKIESLDREFFYDVFYIVPKITKLVFLLDDYTCISFKDIIKKLNIIEKSEFLNVLNIFLLANIDFMGLLEKMNIKTEDYFKHDKNYWSNIDNNVFLSKDKPNIFYKLNIKSISYSIRIQPFRLSLPINRSLSTFDIDPKKNKTFKAVFGNDEDSVVVGYLDDKKIISKMHLKSRKYHRVIGGNMSVNTIFPKGASVNIDIDNFEDIAVNSFDYSEVL